MRRVELIGSGIEQNALAVAVVVSRFSFDRIDGRAGSKGHGGLENVCLPGVPLIVVVVGGFPEEPSVNVFFVLRPGYRPQGGALVFRRPGPGPRPMAVIHIETLSGIAG